jgi:hypothetical protein
MRRRAVLFQQLLDGDPNRIDVRRVADFSLYQDIGVDILLSPQTGVRHLSVVQRLRKVKVYYFEALGKKKVLGLDVPMDDPQGDEGPEGIK